MERDLVAIKEQINTQLADPSVLNTLLATTFKGLKVESARQAMLEGMMRGFSFTDFLEKNIYAIPFGTGYSLLTSIDHARKVGMRSGVIGKSAPIFEEKDGKIVSCSITIKRIVKEHVGEFTATVYFNEYNTNKNQWASKPRTMIAKVAEMHALRMACPEELSQSYIEEDLEQERTRTVATNTTDYRKKLEATKSIEELKTVWASLPGSARVELKDLKEVLKEKLTSPIVEAPIEVTVEDIAEDLGATIIEDSREKPLSNPHLEQARKKLKGKV